MRNFFWKKSSHNLEGSTMYTDYFETIVHNYNKTSILIHNNFVLMLVLVIPQFHHSFFVLNLRLHIIPGAIKLKNTIVK